MASAACVSAVHLVAAVGLGGIFFVGGQPGGLPAISFSTSTRGLRPPLASEIDLDLCTLSSNLRPDLKIPFKFSNLQLPPKTARNVELALTGLIAGSTEAAQATRLTTCPLQTGAGDMQCSGRYRSSRPHQWLQATTRRGAWALMVEFDSSAIVRDISSPDSSLRHYFLWTSWLSQGDERYKS
ncbi:uncharacterized protein LOC124672536 [Lolium rigidum]|uniref:uncharacterized protein LOC124672536 n=1 Tax=Lolium rigidum TaxID=89674 RepID=UPI001F5D58D9|nr:uncharacterized protein LOC124672536 [Lolium rigidum]